MQEKTNDNCGMKGTIKIKTLLIESERAIAINNFLEKVHNIPRAVYETLVKELESICTITNERILYNRVVLTGRSIIAQRLGGDTTYTGIINYGALGSSSTAVSDGQSTLVTEVFRKSYASRTVSGDQVNIDFYYSKGDTNGTYQEFGSFIDATATVDTGQMFNRVLTGGWTKSSLEAMTVSLQVNVNPV